MNKEIALKLIKLYEDAIKVVEGMDDIRLMKVYLKVKHLNMGICKASNSLFDINLYSNKWVTSKVTKDGGYWSEIPYNCSTKTEILASLQTRVDILKTFPGL